MLTASWIVVIATGVTVLIALIINSFVAARKTNISHQGRVTLNSIIILGGLFGLLGIVGIIVFST